MKKFKGCLGVFLIFFLGVVFGAILASGGIYTKVWELIEAGPEKVAEFTTQRLRDELKLNDLQQREFQRITDRTRLKLSALRHDAQPEVDAIMGEADKDLRVILSPKQQRKFDEVMKRYRGKWRADAPATPAPVEKTPEPAPPLN